MAHSGTVVGALWASDLSTAAIDARTHQLAQEFYGTYAFMRQERLISGGVVCEIRA